MYIYVTSEFDVIFQPVFMIHRASFLFMFSLLAYIIDKNKQKKKLKKNAKSAWSTEFQTKVKPYLDKKNSRTRAMPYLVGRVIVVQASKDTGRGSDVQGHPRPPWNH